MFLGIKENKSCIFNPMGGRRLSWGSYYGLIAKIHLKMVLKIRLHIMYVATGTLDIKRKCCKGEGLLQQRAGKMPGDRFLAYCNLPEGCV